MDRTTEREIPGFDGLVWKGGYVVRCNCRPDDGVMCLFHAGKQPIPTTRPCPTCTTGTLTRMKGERKTVALPLGDECKMMGGDAYTFKFNKFVGKMLPSSSPVWTCNTCEHCEAEYDEKAR
jgi:hypothetical protein